MKKYLKEQLGLTYFEIVIGLVMIIVLTLILDVLLVGTALQKKSRYSALAFQLAQEEVEILKRMPVGSLPVGANQPFLGIHYHKGSINVQNDIDAVSTPNVVDIISDPSIAATITGQLVLPQNAYDDGVLNVQMLIKSDSSPPWSGGLLFRSQDENNGYLLTLSSDNSVKLDVIENGVVTNLIDQIYTVISDTWYNLELTLSGDSISLDINGFPEFSTSDTTFSEGYTTLIATDQAHVIFDDLSFGGENWNFDGEPEGKLGGEWQRQGVFELPNGNGLVTVSNYLGSSDIKEVTVRISWNEQSATKQIELVTLITE